MAGGYDPARAGAKGTGSELCAEGCGMDERCRAGGCGERNVPGSARDLGCRRSSGDEDDGGLFGEVDASFLLGVDSFVDGGRGSKEGRAGESADVEGREDCSGAAKKGL